MKGKLQPIFSQRFLFEPLSRCSPSPYQITDLLHNSFAELFETGLSLAASRLHYPRSDSPLPGCRLIHDTGLPAAFIRPCWLPDQLMRSPVGGGPAPSRDGITNGSQPGLQRLERNPGPASRWLGVQQQTPHPRLPAPRRLPQVSDLLGARAESAHRSTPAQDTSKPTKSHPLWGIARG